MLNWLIINQQGVEWRMVAPCINAQLAALERRIVADGSKLKFGASLFRRLFRRGSPHHRHTHPYLVGFDDSTVVFHLRRRQRSTEET